MRPIITSVFLSALMVVAGSAPVHADDDAAALLGKYKAFMGWTLGDGSVSSIRIKGRIADQSSFDQICQPDRYAQYNIGLQSGRPFLVEGGIGSAWISHAGQAKDLPESVGQDAFTQYLLLCNAFALYPGTIIGKIAPAGTNSRTGCALVALRIPKEPLVILAINKDTGELTSVVIDGIASYDAADIRNIDGKRKIYTRWKRKISDSATADLVISAVQVNVRVDPSLFSRTAIDVPPPPDPSKLVTF